METSVSRILRLSFDYNDAMRLIEELNEVMEYVELNAELQSLCDTLYMFTEDEE